MILYFSFHRMYKQIVQVQLDTTKDTATCSQNLQNVCSPDIFNRIPYESVNVCDLQVFTNFLFKF